MDFEKLESNIRALDIDEIIIKAATLHEAELVDLNTSQLESGFLSSGKKTDTYASKTYEKLKKSIGSKSGSNMDFKLEGDFYAGWYIKPVAKGLLFDSKDEKTARLEQKQGSDLFGLTDENKGEAGEIILNDVIQLTYEQATKD